MPTLRKAAQRIRQSHSTTLPRIPLCRVVFGNFESRFCSSSSLWGLSNCCVVCVSASDAAVIKSRRVPQSWDLQQQKWLSYDNQQKGASKDTKVCVASCRFLCQTRMDLSIWRPLWNQRTNDLLIRNVGNPPALWPNNNNNNNNHNVERWRTAHSNACVKRLDLYPCCCHSRCRHPPPPNVRCHSHCLRQVQWKKKLFISSGVANDKTIPSQPTLS